MKLVIQRVSHGLVKVDEQVIGEINRGFVVLVGFEATDHQAIVKKMVEKLVYLRVFSDENDKMNQSILDIEGAILSISQFTLYADCKKGRRPSFIRAAKPEIAQPLYEFFNQSIKEYGIPLAQGLFGADMKVEIHNDGPVTILLDSEEIL